MTTPPSDFSLDLVRQGYALAEGILDDTFLALLRRDLESWIDRADAVRKVNGLGESMQGSAHHTLRSQGALADLIRRLPLDQELRAHFGGPYILNSFGGLMHVKGTATEYAHVHRFHRDVRTYSSELRLMVNMLVMLDDFTVENGATRVLPGSHRLPERPPEDYLQSRSIHLTGRAGTVVLFDSNLWHSASPNRSGEPRRALTMNYTRPLMKQQMDFPRLVGEAFSDDPRVREVIGFRSRVPASHDEWYQPTETRFYYADQG